MTAKPLPDYRFDAPIASVKSLETAANGDLVIEGWGALWEIDREEEAFEPGAFTRGLKSFLAGNALMCFHHKLDAPIGRVLDAEIVEGKGVKLRALVNYQHESSPLRHIYDAIKSGTVNGLSVGGYFKRRLGADGRPRIYDVDIVEWSATGAPVGKNSTFEVIAGKALTDTGEQAANDRRARALADLRRQVGGITRDLELSETRSAIRRLENERDALTANQIATKALAANRPAPPRPAPQAPRHTIAVGGASGTAEVREAAPISDADALGRNERWAERRREMMAARFERSQALQAEGLDAPVWEPIPISPPNSFERPDGVTTITREVETEPDERSVGQRMMDTVKGRPPAPTQTEIVTEIYSAPTPEQVFAAAEVDNA